MRAADSLLQVVQALQPGEAAVPLPAARPAAAGPAPAAPDLRDVKGQAAAKRALEIAAAGGHSLLFIGPPGTGKSMLAQRLAGILPPMDEAEALASAALLGLASMGFDPAAFGRRPFRAPHHSASAAALVGGGSLPRPGEISLAHGGVLFLDELPEFPRAALEALREPLETGQHHALARGAAGGVPGALPAAGGHEPLPLRLAGRADRPRANTAAARPTRWRATRRGCRGRCSTASTCRWKCRRSRPSS